MSTLPRKDNIGNDRLFCSSSDVFTTKKDTSVSRHFECIRSFCSRFCFMPILNAIEMGFQRVLFSILKQYLMSKTSSIFLFVLSFTPLSFKMNCWNGFVVYFVYFLFYKKKLHKFGLIWENMRMVSGNETIFTWLLLLTTLETGIAVLICLIILQM